MNNGNNKQHPQQQNVQNERKITNHLTYNSDHYQLNGINWRQRTKRATNNLLDDNELFTNYESSQNDGNVNELKRVKNVKFKFVFFSPF